MAADSRGAIPLAERILALLDRGSFVSTYKYAVLLALIDLAMERTARDGSPPERILTAELAEKVTKLYWPQAIPARFEHGEVLKQSTGSQARIVGEIAAFRDRFGEQDSLYRARLKDPGGFATLIDSVELKLVEMPLPRLQIFGAQLDEFLYSISWTAEDTNTRNSARRSSLLRQVREAQRRRRDPEAMVGGEWVPPVADLKSELPVFVPELRLVSGVAEGLLQLAGLLRPLIQREWAAGVARTNKLEQADLEAFLFGSERASLQPLRADLVELQDSRCFYCGKALTAEVEIDHFLPWSRHPDNAIENLVAADADCNGSKSDFLAAPDHLTRWTSRLRKHASELREIAERRKWESRPARPDAVARAVYLRLPEAALLWQATGTFVPADPSSIRGALR